jgi:hypothetical protein
MERFRSALKQKVGEVAGLEARVRELEATRDALAQELLVATQAAEQVGGSLLDGDCITQGLYHVRLGC